MASARQRCGKGVEGLPAHYHRVPHGGFLKKAKFFGNVPWQLVIAANDAVIGHCRNYNYFHSGLICVAGWKKILYLHRLLFNNTIILGNFN